MDVTRDPGGSEATSPTRFDPGATTSSLLRELILGRSSRWASFVARYGPLVRRCARFHGLRTHDVEDVVQAVLMRVLTRIERFRRDGAGSSFRGWVWTISQHESIEKIRREGRQPSVAGDLGWVIGTLGDLEGGAVVAATSSGPDLERMRRAVELALAEVEPKSRERILATYRDGRPPADIAEEHGVSVGSIWTLRSRFRARVRQFDRELARR